MIRILVEEFNSSGGLKVVALIANMLAMQDEDVGVVCPAYSPSPFYPFDRRVKIIRIGKTSIFGKILYFYHLFIFLQKYSGPIITSNFRLIVLVAISRFIKGSGVFKPVLLIQGLDDISLIKLSKSNFLVKFINYCFYYISKKIDVHRVFVSNYLRAAYGSKGTVIQNGISRTFLSEGKVKVVDQLTVTIGTVSTSAANKGFDLFLSCADRLVSSMKLIGYDVLFVCATQDPILLEMNIDGLQFKSPRTETEMLGFYRSCDILLTLSHSEGFNLPALEAMACGCLVVSTDNGGVNDFIYNDYNGLISKCRDAGSICNIVCGLILDPVRMMNIQEMAQLSAKTFASEIFELEYFNFFKDIGYLSVSK